MDQARLALVLHSLSAVVLKMAEVVEAEMMDEYDLRPAAKTARGLLDEADELISQTKRGT